MTWQKCTVTFYVFEYFLLVFDIPNNVRYIYRITIRIAASKANLIIQDWDTIQD